ncbi:hypothetical protein [Chryseobacterium koreense]|nr:hypothetical protein [Chryseobacterium koreense]MBB5333571.1 hypothetical protein [Chryseobacterium koreense]
MASIPQTFHSYGVVISNHIKATFYTDTAPPEHFVAFIDKENPAK